MEKDKMEMGIYYGNSQINLNKDIFFPKMS